MTSLVFRLCYKFGFRVCDSFSFRVSVTTLVFRVGEKRFASVSTLVSGPCDKSVWQV